MRPKSKFRYVNHDLWVVTEGARKQVQMSALGQKQTSAHVRVMSALSPKADIAPGTMTHRAGRPRRSSGTAAHGLKHFRQHPS